VAPSEREALPKDHKALEENRTAEEFCRLVFRSGLALLKTPSARKTKGPQKVRAQAVNSMPVPEKEFRRMRLQ
jgi:hypothetical protein